MTNEEKYLKDEVDVEELANKFVEYFLGCGEILEESFISFFKQEAKPTLTEDEKVILRNTKGYTTIIRNIEGNIQIENEDGSFACLCTFNHLFQFIQPRRRI